jgi:hypothetical protein
MSITHRIAIASGFALALLASSVAPASSAPIASSVVASNVQLTAAADVTSANAGVQSVRLTLREMSLIQGDGFWQKVKKWVQKQTKWLVGFGQEVARVINQIEQIVEILFGHDDNPQDSVITEANVTESNEYYATDDDIAVGNAFGSSSSETGYQVISVTYSGGGGGTCLTDDGCQYAY